MTVLVSKQTVEDSLQVAHSLETEWQAADPNDPRLTQVNQIVKHLVGVLHSQPDQMVQDGVSTIEDYLDDASQPETAVQIKQEVDVIAQWRFPTRDAATTKYQTGDLFTDS